MHEELIKIQPQFKSNLVEAVEVFKQDLGAFHANYTNVRMYNNYCVCVYVCVCVCMCVYVYVYV